MKQGFMEHVRKVLILDFPGQTAEWYAKAYLEEAGHDGSDSKIPVRSLTNTLSKQVKNEREKNIRRERIKGIYHYFPVSAKFTHDTTKEEVITQLNLPVHLIRDIDNLVVLGKVLSRNDAIFWLILKGREAKRAYLDRLEGVRNRIELLKKEVEEE